MSLVEVNLACDSCELKGLQMSADQARACGHIILEGNHMPRKDSRRELDLRRVASTALDYFEAEPAVKQAATACVGAHLNGSCDYIQEE
jgi:hypothetical protein